VEANSYARYKTEVNSSLLRLEVEISKTLRFWVKCEYADRREESSTIEKPELLEKVLCEFEFSEM
jgi:hypothetical protein